MKRVLGLTLIVIAVALTIAWCLGLLYGLYGLVDWVFASSNPSSEHSLMVVAATDPEERG